MAPPYRYIMQGVPGRGYAVFPRTPVNKGKEKGRAGVSLWGPGPVFAGQGG